MAFAIVTIVVVAAAVVIIAVVVVIVRAQTRVGRKSRISWFENRFFSFSSSFSVPF